MRGRLHKICRPCFDTLCPGQKPGAVTWGRQCDQCRKPTPSLSTLVKVDLVRPEEVRT